MLSKKGKNFKIVKKLIDWEEQWAAFAPGFKDGILQVPVGNTTISLCAGGGFGDLSHPTTKLMLQLMPEHIAGKTIVDIGCGSGILSIAALKLGAKKVYALDISDDALEHTQKNAERNHVSIETSRQLRTIPEDNLLILMNMIFSEQEVAWEMNSCLHEKSALLITSGILEEQDVEYQNFIKNNKLSFFEKQTLENWAAYKLIK
ncbi:MAG: hypothetical protein ChlgKO_05240 [Chlamydiales bacterium]